MAIIKYQSGLVLNIQDNRLRTEITMLDVAGNNDGIVTALDFGGDETKLLDATCDVFFPSSPGAMTQQEKGFREFVGLYGRVKQFKGFTNYMDDAEMFSFYPGRLEFDEMDWPAVSSQMTGNGAFTPQKIAEMAYDIYRTFRRLEGRLDSDKRPSINTEPQEDQNGNGSIIGFSYNWNNVPEFLGGKMREVADAYLAGANLLRSYNKVVCEDFNRNLCGDAWVLIERLPYLKEIRAGGSYDITRVYRGGGCNKDGHAGGIGGH